LNKDYEAVEEEPLKVPKKIIRQKDLFYRGGVVQGSIMTDPKAKKNK